MILKYIRKQKKKIDGGLFSNEREKEGVCIWMEGEELEGVGEGEIIIKIDCMKIYF